MRKQLKLRLSFRSIIGDNYPCLITLWSGYVGTIILFNSYLWRCELTGLLHTVN